MTGEKIVFFFFHKLNCVEHFFQLLLNAFLSSLINENCSIQDFVTSLFTIDATSTRVFQKNRSIDSCDPLTCYFDKMFAINFCLISTRFQFTTFHFSLINITKTVRKIYFQTPDIDNVILSTVQHETEKQTKPMQNFIFLYYRSFLRAFSGFELWEKKTFH